MTKVVPEKRPITYNGVQPEVVLFVFLLDIYAGGNIDFGLKFLNGVFNGFIQFEFSRISMSPFYWLVSL